MARTSSPFFSACPSKMLTTPSISAGSEKACASSSTLPASSLERSRMSLSRRSRLLLEFVDRIGEMLRFAVEFRVRQHRRQSDHGIHRRADLVAHHRQEFRLRPAGGGRRLLLPAQPLREAVQIALRARQHHVVPEQQRDQEDAADDQAGRQRGEAQMQRDQVPLVLGDAFGAVSVAGGRELYHLPVERREEPQQLCGIAGPGNIRRPAAPPRSITCFNSSTIARSFGLLSRNSATSPWLSSLARLTRTS